MVQACTRKVVRARFRDSKRRSHHFRFRFCSQPQTNREKCEKKNGGCCAVDVVRSGKIKIQARPRDHIKKHCQALSSRVRWVSNCGSLSKTGFTSNGRATMGRRAQSSTLVPFIRMRLAFRGMSLLVVAHVFVVWARTGLLCACTIYARHTHAYTLRMGVQLGQDLPVHP